MHVTMPNKAWSLSFSLYRGFVECAIGRVCLMDDTTSTLVVRCIGQSVVVVEAEQRVLDH